MIVVKRALLSVSDKSGIVEFARGLSEKGIELIATGNTFKLIKEGGINVTQVSEITGFPEILDGRVKTLHPKIFGGILAKKDDPEHRSALESHNIPSIDMVVLNFYPFEKVVQKPDVTTAEAIEQIDIGGPSMLRSAAKNCRYVVPVSDPGQYNAVLQEITEEGGVKEGTSFRLAQGAFSRTMSYDGAIQSYFSAQLPETDRLPERLLFVMNKEQDLRYGENPHMPGSVYRWASPGPSQGVFSFIQKHGKELSFNNIYDLNGALKIPVVYSEPCVAIIKHANPCGVGIGATINEAYEQALACDPISAFGGIIAANGTINGELAGRIAERFYEVVAAPEFTSDALERLQKKKKLIIMDRSEKESRADDTYGGLIYKAIEGGMLVQKASPPPVTPDKFRVVTRRQPAPDEQKAMLFGWNMIRFVKSNAIVIMREDRTIGIGAGQMSRVDSSRIAIQKARDAGHEIKGAATASDAFFPFRDNIDLLAEAGVTAVIQPGGSIRDKEVIDAADEHNMAMWFTGYRQFLH